MKHGMISKAAIAVFVASMAFVGSASAAAPNIACTSQLAGQTVYTTSGGYRYYYQCRPPAWVFLRACPVGGGHCLS